MSSVQSMKFGSLGPCETLFSNLLQGFFWYSKFELSDLRCFELHLFSNAVHLLLFFSSQFLKLLDFRNFFLSVLLFEFFLELFPLLRPHQ